MKKKFYSLVDIVFDFLNDKCNPATGLWGEVPTNPEQLTNQVQAAYHFWLLYSYDEVTLPHFNKAIPHILATQSKLGDTAIHPYHSIPVHAKILILLIH